MLKMWMEEYLPGFYIKYDGFRDSNQYTVLSPEGRVKDVDTLEKAHALLVESNGFYGSKVSCKVHYPFNGPESKWYLSNCGGKEVCVVVEFSDGYFLVDFGLGDPMGLQIVCNKDLT